jgi:hypothetical protein
MAFSPVTLPCSIPPSEPLPFIEQIVRARLPRFAELS